MWETNEQSGMDPVQRLAQSHREFGEFGGVNPSIEVSTTFTVLEPGTLPAIFAGERGPGHGCYVYGRSFNPTVRALGRQLAALEGTEAAYACSSGMAAISAALLAFCSAGDHIVASNTVYGGTYALLHSFLPKKNNIYTTFVDIHNLAAVEAAIKPNTKVIYTETISNPTLTVSDLPALARLAHSRGIKLVVDNTFAPCIISPARWGADVVVHSMTKFISGASDIIAGAICGSSEFIQSLMDFHEGPCMLLGPTMDPKVASELLLRLPHLALRVQEHSRRAAVLARKLGDMGAKVTYPGLPGHRDHELMKQLMNDGYGFGGLLGIDLGTQARADAFMQRLQNKHSFGFMAVSLGYFDTLMSVSAASTSSEMTEDDMKASGISHGYVRMSVGITGTLEQRCQQLEEAYRFVSKLEGAEAPYHAVKVKRAADGQLTRVLSWPSMGSFQKDADGAADEESLDDAYSKLAEMHTAAMAGGSTAPEAAAAGPAPPRLSAAPAVAAAILSLHDPRNSPTALHEPAMKIRKVTADEEIHFVPSGSLKKALSQRKSSMAA